MPSTSYLIVSIRDIPAPKIRADELSIAGFLGGSKGPALWL
jgi:hypothetical protein